MKIMPNIELCVDCGKCERSCPHNAIFIVEGIPIRCMHCESAPCVQVCPEDALKKVGDRIILDNDKCIGCSLCTEVCPIGAIRIDTSSGIATKCNDCMEFDSEICVDVCPTGALSSYTKIVEDKREDMLVKLKKLTSLNK
ncbi:4Fe-4S binding protein [Methanococcus voltae]|uniref:Ferredoxin n=1 Tax=Methanococcus voltae PS TaxID=523842 RepID=A0ABT2EXJ9_METVO|nr:4Fe-4S binding protein [Methanococcus voltae]MBP2172142.1 carbon-monoxide dehydrogenase iron sulfur subunit [Methanococcus voltae]MCS3921625.1 carbon-monoxide dehydrogenase iron sulfur subunit [Methanococcus voltae PS]